MKIVSKKYRIIIYFIVSLIIFGSLFYYYYLLQKIKADYIQSQKEPAFQISGLDKRVGLLDYSPNGLKMKSLGAAYTKIIFSWNTVQPTENTTPNKYNYRDDLVNNARSNGLEIVGIIQSRSNWGTKRKVSDCSCSSLPNNENQYKNFVKNLVSHHSSITYWELEGEQDSLEKWPDAPQEYVTLLSWTHQAIKSVNSNNKLISGGITGRSTRTLAFCDRGISDSYCTSGWNNSNHPSQRAKVMLVDGKNYYDIVSFHPYIEIGEQENASSNFKSWLSEHGINKETWVGETGGPLINVSRERFIPPDPNSEQENAEQVVKRFVSLFSLGISRVFWFVLSSITTVNPDANNPKALLRLDGSEKPGASTYRYVAQKLNQFYTLGKIWSSNDLVVYRVYYRPKNQNNSDSIWIAWNPARTNRTVDLSNIISKDNFLNITVDGSSSNNFNPRNVNVGSQPIFITLGAKIPPGQENVNPGGGGAGGSAAGGIGSQGADLALGEAPSDNPDLSIDPPTKLIAVDFPNDSGGKIELNWQRSTTPDIDGYKIFRKEEAGEFGKIVQVSKDSDKYIDAKAEISKKYFYIVRAYIGDRESKSSNEYWAISIDNIGAEADKIVSPKFLKYLKWAVVGTGIICLILFLVLVLSRIKTPKLKPAW